MAGVPSVVIRIAAETAGAVSDIHKVNDALGDQVTAGSKAGSALKKAAAPAAAAFAVASAAVIDFTKAAAEDADGQAELAGSLERTTGATKKQVKAAEDYIGTLSAATGVADDDLRPALSKLAAASGSVAKGQEQMSLAVDIAAQSHESLSTVTDALVQADQGRLRGLAKLVPGIDMATVKQKDQTKALEEAAKLTGGAAAEAASTYGGQMKVMTNQVNEAEESIGAAFLPVLESLMPVLKTVTDLISGNTRVFSILLGAVLAVSGAIIAANAAMKAYQAATVLVKVATTVWTGVQWLLNAALDANPIGLIVLAIVGAAGLIYALKKAYDSSDAFRKVVNELWDAIKTGAKVVLAPLILQFEALKKAVELAQAVFNSPFARKALDDLSALLKPLVDLAQRLGEFLGKVAAITFDALIASVKTLIGWLGKIHIPKIPHIPGLPGTFAVAVPAGRAFGLAGVPATRSSSTGDALTINVFGAIDPEGTARQIRRLLDGHDRRQGRTQ